MGWAQHPRQSRWGFRQQVAADTFPQCCVSSLIPEHKVVGRERGLIPISEYLFLSN